MKKREDSKKIALERVKALLEEAEKNKNLANRNVTLARKIAMKVNLKIPSEYKRKFCKHCYSYFRSTNCRVRTREGKVIYYCLNCKKYTRIPIK